MLFSPNRVKYGPKRAKNGPKRAKNRHKRTKSGVFWGYPSLFSEKIRKIVFDTLPCSEFFLICNINMQSFIKKEGHKVLKNK